MWQTEALNDYSAVAILSIRKGSIQIDSDAVERLGWTVQGLEWTSGSVKWALAALALEARADVLSDEAVHSTPVVLKLQAFIGL